MATGTLRLMSEMAVMVCAGGLRQPPDSSSRLPVALRLIVLDRRRTSFLPFGPGIMGLFTTVLVENLRRDL
jgi:hypothetical protein